jgi:threonylcarbamoyladenosine tRNA methylthiotransferase MtaB
VKNDDKPRLIPLLTNVDAESADGAEQHLFSAGSARSALIVRDGDGPCGAPIEPGVMGRTAYTLRVQTGCAEPCSYCIIPSTRGRPRSVAIDDVVREVDRVVAAGFKEIALTGVHLGSYGRDLEPQSSLFDLLSCVGAEPRSEPVLFRISSLEPMDCSHDIVDLVASSDRFAPHFHLPLQHASNRILAAMRRPYSIECYASLVDRIRSRIPHASIGTDVIVGFPGERDDDFDELAGYLERSPLTHVHVFPYSDRPGTEASKLPSKVAGAVIRERGARLRGIARALSTQFRGSQVGTEHRALTLEDGSLAVTGNYLKVRIPAGRQRNEWIRVRLNAEGQSGELLAG